VICDHAGCEAALEIHAWDAGISGLTEAVRSISISLGWAWVPAPTPKNSGYHLAYCPKHDPSKSS
jgi:hypothetical protein